MLQTIRCVAVLDQEARFIQIAYDEDAAKCIISENEKENPRGVSLMPAMVVYDDGMVQMLGKPKN